MRALCERRRTANPVQHTQQSRDNRPPGCNWPCVLPMAADSKADGGLVDRSVMLHSGAQRAFQAHARHCWVALASAPPLFRNLSSLALPERAAKRLKVFSSSVCGPMPPVPLSVTVPAQPSMPLFESTFKIRPMTARDEALRAKAMDSDRKAAIKKWVSLITVAPNCWEVSRLTMQSAQPSDLTGGLLESVSTPLQTNPTRLCIRARGPWFVMCNSGMSAELPVSR